MRRPPPPLALGLALACWVVLGLGAGAPCAAAEEAPTAADVTEPGRSLARAVRVALGSSETGKRTVVFLVDPTPSLKAAGFAEVFAAELAPALAAAPKLQVGLVLATDAKGWTVAPTRDAAALGTALTDALAAAKANFRNVYASARRVGSLLAKRTGARELVLVVLDNGDTEDDVAGTASALARLKVRTSCVTTEAYLADSYYLSSKRTVPRGVSLGSGDAPWVTLPWGWLFQQTVANETTPSGYAHYGLTRLAAATDGRVFLYTAPGGSHTCAYFGSCMFCLNNDHQPSDEAFQTHRLKQLAPTAAGRKDAGSMLARDPWFRAMLTAWDQAAKAGLTRSKPSVRVAGGRLKPERRTDGRWESLLGSPSGWKRLAGKADKTRAQCDKIIAALRKTMEGIGDENGNARCRAMCDFTLAMLHVTRANLVAYAAFCREVGPQQLGRDARAIEPPELSPVIEGRQIAGISYTPMVLCHGVRPFFHLRLPGGDAWRQELEALDEVVAGFMRRYGHTPYAMALRHQGIARFTYTYRGTGGTPPPRPKANSRSDNETTETGRPNRSGGSSSGGGSSGPTTGGG